MSACLKSRVVLATVLMLGGCASTGPGAERPVLYPNTAFKTMGEAAARQHLARCEDQARQAGLRPAESAAAQSALRGATVAGVSSAVGALVFGRGNLEDAVKRGAQGAAVGGAAGAAGGAVNERPNSTYRQFVQRCASEQGLDVIGWN